MIQFIAGFYASGVLMTMLAVMTQGRLAPPHRQRLMALALCLLWPLGLFCELGVAATESGGVVDREQDGVRAGKVRECSMFKPAEQTTRLNDCNSLGPWMHYAVVVRLVGEIGNSLVVNAHRFNYIPCDSVERKVALVKDQLDELVLSYGTAYAESTPEAH